MTNNTDDYQTQLLTNSSKLNLNSNDLFDRIINLKITTGSYSKDSSSALVADTYVIRSDYEVVYPTQDVTQVMRKGKVANDKYYVQRCKIKPNIKIQYKNLGAGTHINIDIFISNFFMLDEKGQQLMSFSQGTYPIKKIEILMGYWGQFRDLINPDTATIADLHDFDRIGNGINKINCEVAYVKTDKLPPDYVLHVSGFVGFSVYNSPVSSLVAKNYDKAQPYAVQVASNGNLTALDEILYQQVTRRYVKSSVLDNLVKTQDGYLSVANADRYGVKVYCSEGANKISKEYLEMKKKNSEGNDITDAKRIYFPFGSSAENTVINIINAISSSLQYVIDIDGSIYVYDYNTEAKDIQKLYEALKDKKAQAHLENYTPVNSYYGNILPAVYNINVDALTTIVAPFFYIIDSLDYVFFKNRYSLSSLVSYYADFNGTIDKFFVIRQTVSFATVEDVNEMTLVCQGSSS